MTEGRTYKKKSVLYPYKYKKNSRKLHCVSISRNKKKKWRTMQHHREKKYDGLKTKTKTGIKNYNLRLEGLQELKKV